MIDVRHRLNCNEIDILYFYNKVNAQIDVSKNKISVIASKNEDFNN